MNLYPAFPRWLQPSEIRITEGTRNYSKASPLAEEGHQKVAFLLKLLLLPFALRLNTIAELAHQCMNASFRKGLDCHFQLLPSLSSLPFLLSLFCPTYQHMQNNSLL